MLGKGGVNRHIQGITKPAIRRLARRGGVKRISGLIYEETRGILKVFLENIIRDAVAYTEHAMMKTVTAMDVVYSLKLYSLRVVREVRVCRVRVCVRELTEGGLQEATFSKSARKQLLGCTSGLLFVHLQEQEELQEAKERLRSLLVNSPQHPRPAPAPAVLPAPRPGRPAVPAGAAEGRGQAGRAPGAPGLHGHLQHPADRGHHLSGQGAGAAASLPAGAMQEADFVEDFLARCVFQQWFSSRKERRALDLPDRPTGRWPGQSLCRSSHTYLPRSAVLCRRSR